MTVVVTPDEGEGDAAADAAEAATDAAVAVAAAVGEGVADAVEAVAELAAAAIEAVTEAQGEPAAVPVVAPEHEHDWRAEHEARIVAVEERVGAVELLVAEEDEPEGEVLTPDVTVDELDTDTNASGGGGFWSRLLKG